MKRGYSTSELVESKKTRRDMNSSPPPKKMVISGRLLLPFALLLLHRSQSFLLDIFQIYSPPPTQNKFYPPRGISSSLPDHLPPGIPNIDLCHDFESRRQYDPTYAWSIMQYKSSIEVRIFSPSLLTSLCLPLSVSLSLSRLCVFSENMSSSRPSQRSPR
jgi:hypothetical protein